MLYCSECGRETPTYYRVNVGEEHPKLCRSCAEIDAHELSYHLSNVAVEEDVDESTT